jgi:hypothetical protein
MSGYAGFADMVPAFAAAPGAPELLVLVLIVAFLFTPLLLLGGLGYMAFRRNDGEDGEVADLAAEVDRLRDRIDRLEGENDAGENGDGD